MARSIIIIGAGVAGLSAGCYAQMNGYKSIIFEAHSQPGGLCSTWRRDGYTFDGCIHWMMGTDPVHSFYPMWKELGVIQGQNFHNPDEFMRLNIEGKELIVPADLGAFRKELHKMAPEDGDLIEEFCGDLNTLSKYDLFIDKAPETSNIIDRIRKFRDDVPYASILEKYHNISIADFANNFKDPWMKEAFKHMFYNIPQMSMISLMHVLAAVNNQAAGFPLGGSLEMSRSMEKRYKALGGDIQYGKKVFRVNVENNRAIGVELEDGTKVVAEHVISAADGHQTLYDLLDGKHMDQNLSQYYDEQPVFNSRIQISMGVAADLSHLPESVFFKLSKPIDVSGEKYEYMFFRNYSFDKSMAADGHTAVSVAFKASYRHWEELSREKLRYDQAREEISKKAITALDRMVDGIAPAIEVTDVATPVTLKNYTNSWQGSWQGWLDVAYKSKMKITKTLPGLSNFYMAGQWTEPMGGVPFAAMTGRHAMQLICKADGKDFKATIPEG